MTLVNMGPFGFVDLPTFLTDPVLAAGFAIVIFAAVVAFRWLMRSADPDGRFIGVMQFHLPGHFMRAKVWESTEALDPANIDVIRETEQGKIIADVLADKTVPKFFYKLKLEGVQGATLSSGLAMLLTHNSLEDPRYARQIGKLTDWWRGLVYLKEANQATSQGGVWEDYEGFDGENVHLIYYPMVDAEGRDAQVVIGNAKATLAIASQMAVYVKSVEKSKYYELAAETATKHATEMEKIAVAKNGQVNDLTALLAQKMYDSINEMFKTTGLNAYFSYFLSLMSVIIGYQVMQASFPLADMTLKILVGGLFGIPVLLILNSRQKPNAVAKVS